MEINIIKDSSYERGWAVFTLYGALAATLLTSIHATAYTMCCFYEYTEGFDNSDTLVLKRRSPQMKYVSSTSGHYDPGNGSSNGFSYPARDY